MGFYFLIAFLICYGITMIITESKIFSPVRNLGYSISKGLGEFLECPMCIGFWVGLTFEWVTSWYSYFVYETFAAISQYSFLNTLIYMVCIGAMTSGVCWLLYCITMFLNPKEEELEFVEMTEGDTESDPDINLELESHVSEKLAKELKDKYDITVTLTKNVQILTD